MRINPQPAARWISILSPYETVSVHGADPILLFFFFFKAEAAGISVDEVLYSMATVNHLDEQSLSLLLP